MDGWQECQCNPCCTGHKQAAIHPLAIKAAVGTAAAYAIQNGLTPRQTANPKDNHIVGIQQKLLEDDMNIPGLSSQDDNDLARKARITASSESKLDFGKEDW